MAGLQTNINSVYSMKYKLNEMKKVLRDPILIITIIFVLISLTLFILLPLYKILRQSVIDNNGIISISAYIRAFKYSDNVKAITNTFSLGTVVGLLATLVGFIFAYCDAYVKIPGKKLFNLIALLPIISPPFAIALSMILLFGNRGLITKMLLGLDNVSIYGFKGVVLAQTLSFFPIAYLLLCGLLKNIDASMEEASRNLGASRGKTFLTITLPLMLPGLANSFLLIFMQAVADFGNPMTIGGNFSTLATQTYLQAIGNYDMQGGTAIAMVLLSISIALFVFAKYWVEKKAYVTVTGKPSKERVLIKEKYIVLPLGGFCLIASAFIILCYILIPLGSLVKLWGINYNFTFDHYIYAFNVSKKAMFDTTWLSLVSTPFTGLLGMIIAFLIVRKRFAGRRFIEFTSMLCIAVPGTVIGIGYILAYNSKPIVLTGTAIILILSFIFRSMPVGIRSGISSLQQIDPAIEEAAADMGANSFKIFKSVTLPLIKTAFFSGLVYTFVRSMTAISAVIFLVSARYNLLTVSTLNMVESGRIGDALAVSTMLIIIVYSVILLLYQIIGAMGVSKKDIKLS